MKVLLHSLPACALVLGELTADLPAAQQIVGIDVFGGEVFSLDVRTGQAALIADPGLDIWIWTGVAKDQSGRLFGAYFDWQTLSGTAIYEIDPWTGQVTQAAFTPLIGVAGMSFGDQDALFMAVERNYPMGGSPIDLYTVDLATGAPTLVGDMGSTGLGTLAYDGADLWAYDFNLGLVRVDQATGQMTDVNPSFLGPLDLTENICFGDDGILYQVDAGFWIQDTLTGVPSFVNLTGFPGLFAGVEYLPGPTTPFTLGTQGETGGPMGAQVWGATPNGTVVLLRAQGGGGPTAVPGGNPCAGTLLDLNATIAPLAVLRADAQGRARLGPAFVPASAALITHLQAINLATCAISNPLRILY